MNFDKKKIIVGVIVIAVLAVGIFIFMSRTPGTSAPAVSPTGSPSATKGTATREAAPQSVVVPEKGAQVPDNVASVNVVSAANPGNNSSYRSFEGIKIEGGVFNPDTVIARQGDIVNFSVTAVDSNYDFTQPDYGFKETIKRGETKKIQFGATAAGKFLFYCASCGGPAKGPVGYIVVASKK